MVKHCGSVPSVAARRHDGDQFVEVEVNDHLQCLASWALAQGYGETVEPGRIFGLHPPSVPTLLAAAPEATPILCQR